MVSADENYCSEVLRTVFRNFKTAIPGPKCFGALWAKLTLPNKNKDTQQVKQGLNHPQFLITESQNNTQL